MKIEKFHSFKYVDELNEEFSLKNMWQDIKYGMSKLGRYKAGGKIFGKGKVDQEAAEEIGMIMGDASNAILKKTYDVIKDKYPGWPNTRSRRDFLEGIITYGQLYDSIVAATKKQPGEDGYLDPAVANELIKNLQKVVKKALDVDLAAVYSVMDSKENIDLKAEELLFEQMFNYKDEMINEEEEFFGKLMDKMFGKKDEDSLPRKAGGRQSAKLQGAGDDGTVNSERMKTLKSWRLPLALMGAGASFGALSWLIEYMFPAEKITTYTPEEIKQITEKTLGHVTPGDGLSQTFNAMKDLGVNLTPNSSPDEVVGALSKLGGGDAMKGVEIITQEGGIFTDPDAARGTLTELVSDPHKHGDTLKEVFTGVRSGTGKVVGDTLECIPGSSITTKIVSVVVKWTAKTIIKKSAIALIAGPILKTIGIGLVGAGLVAKLLREKGQRQSRAKTLNDLLQSLKPVPVPANNPIIQAQKEKEGQTQKEKEGQTQKEKESDKKGDKYSDTSIYPIMIKNLKALQSMIITYRGASLEGQGGSEEEKEYGKRSKEELDKKLKPGKFYYYTNQKGQTRKVKLISLTHDTNPGKDKEWITADDKKERELEPKYASVIYPDRDGKYTFKSPEIAVAIDKLKAFKEGVTISRFEDMLLEKEFSKGPRNAMVGKEDSYATQALTNVRRSIKSFLEDKMKVDKDSTIKDILDSKMDSDTKEGVKTLYSNVYEYLFGKYSKTLSDPGSLYKENVATDKKQNLVFAEKMARLYKRTSQFEGENLYAPMGEFGEDLKEYNETMKIITDYFKNKTNENFRVKRFGNYFKS
jgi:hypothetical protein